MVKDSSRETSIKKKRKNNLTTSEIERDIYKKAIDFEEKEALNRPSEIDAKIYFDACKEIRQLLNEISDLKQLTGPDVRHKILEKTTEASLRFVLLKKLNRMEKVRFVLPKEQLTAEKQKVDSINLQYQNLLYEANHLKSEYRKCFQFKSKDENIELVLVSEFLSEAPKSLTEKFETLDDDNETQKHELRLARLEWEYKQRIQLAELCKQLEDEKKSLERDIAERKNKLEKLAPLLASVLEATKPVQAHLGLEIDKIQAEHKLAALLPNPLYLFYANVDAYRQVNDSSMVVEISGDQEEAVQYQQAARVDEEEESEPEVEVLESEEVAEPKKRRHRKVALVDPMEEKKKKLFEVHPLTVEVTVKTKEKISILLKFGYCTKLDLVTVTSSVTMPEPVAGLSIRDVLSHESLLVELVEGDFGVESPNPCTAYQLKKVGLSSFRGMVATLGYCYNWAQKVCGRDFLAKEPKGEVLCQASVEFVMGTIKKRLRSRFALALQLEQLEKCQIPGVPDEVNLPKSWVSKVVRWRGCSWQDYCQASGNDGLISEEIVQNGDLFYLASINRGNATLQAYIAIKNTYPTIAPILSISIDYKREKRLSSNDDNIREIERSVNIDWKYDGTNANWLLAAQISALCVAFDVYLETDDPNIFTQTTMFINASCGRNRRKPFKFCNNQGSGLFTQ